MLVVNGHLPWLPLSLLLQEDPAHQGVLGVQGGPDLPLVQSHLWVPVVERDRVKEG